MQLHIRHSFVNLASLHSVKPWPAAQFHIRHKSVSLGNLHSKGSSASTNLSTATPVISLTQTRLSARGSSPVIKPTSKFSYGRQQPRLDKPNAPKQNQGLKDMQRQLFSQSAHEPHNLVRRVASIPNPGDHCVKHVFLKQDVNPNPDPNAQDQHIRQEATTTITQSDRRIDLSKQKTTFHDASTSLQKPHSSSVFPNSDATLSLSQLETNSLNSPPSIISTPAPSALAALRARTSPI